MVAGAETCESILISRYSSILYQSIPPDLQSPSVILNQHGNSKSRPSNVFKGKLASFRKIALLACKVIDGYCTSVEHEAQPAEPLHWPESTPLKAVAALYIGVVWRMNEDPC